MLHDPVQFPANDNYESLSYLMDVQCIKVTDKYLEINSFATILRVSREG